MQEKLKRADALAAERDTLTNHLRRTLEQQDLRVKQVRRGSRPWRRMYILAERGASACRVGRLFLCVHLIGGYLLLDFSLPAHDTLALVH